MREVAAYYNENDPKTAAWLRELIKAGLIADGEVDERSIKDVRPADVAGFQQCHFFAGIGGWSYALRLAGWEDDRPVWTGSCPCQPFSQAGQRKGDADERHLWPEFRRLISECSPAICFGEQVTSDDGLIWLTRVRADLEELGYAVGCADLCAAGEKSPHRRQRLYFVAESRSIKGSERYDPKVQRRRQKETEQVGPGSRFAMLGHAKSSNGEVSVFRGQESPEPGRASSPDPWSDFIIAQCEDGYRRINPEPRSFPLAHGIPARMVRLRGYGNAIVPQVAALFIQAYMQTLNP